MTVLRVACVSVLLAIGACRKDGGDGAQAGGATGAGGHVAAGGGAAAGHAGGGAGGSPAGEDGAAGADPDVAAPGETVVIAAAGDVACRGCDQLRTAALLKTLLQQKQLAAILALGDLAYQNGTLAEYTQHYAPAWGAPELKALTRPVPGGHEYYTPEAQGYFDYFNGVGIDDGPAGPRGRGYYSFDVGEWHLIALNTSNDACTFVPCGVGSEQLAWLQQDLAASRRRCTLAYWHTPRFQQGTFHGNSSAPLALWNTLYDAGAEIVLTGHEHSFQVLAPLDKQARIDRARGLRSFVVGTGGSTEHHTTFDENVLPGLIEFKVAGTVGVLELTLEPDRYDWRFLDAQSRVVHSGSDLCH